MSNIIILQINNHIGAVDSKFGITGLDQLYQTARKQMVEELGKSN